MEKAREEAIAAFIKSDEFTNHLDHHYVVGYEDFRVDAKETYPEVDFDSFEIPTATKSSLLLMSSEDVNVVDNASIELAQYATAASKDDPKFGGDASAVYPCKFIFPLEIFFIILVYWKCSLFWASHFKIHSSTIP